MARNSAHTCPDCNTSNKTVLADTQLLICRHCGRVVLNNLAGGKKIEVAKVPEDWSFIQIGTTATHDSTPFTVVGRVRLQLRNDYKNFWCGAQADGECIWIAESFASFSIFRFPWTEYTGDEASLKAGGLLKFSHDKTLKLRGEYVEKCEAISAEGEIGDWRLFDPGFFFVQAGKSGKRYCRAHHRVKRRRRIQTWPRSRTGNA